MEFMIGIAAMVAGLVQGITGFGAGIVLMMALPMVYALPQSAGISGAICILLCISMVYTYRKHIQIKKIVLPAILYIFVCSVTIRFSTVVDQMIMKKVFGFFLLILSVYYLFGNTNKEKKKLRLGVSVFCIVVSAICDGLFGIGGPLMVLYFLSLTEDTYEYLGTLQAFFVVNSIYNTGYRVYMGILLPQHLFIIGIGIIGIVIGGWVAKTVVHKLDDEMVRKLTYSMIGISGILNIL